MHQLWNDQFDDAQNYRMFGKCANPAGHGHNYILEVRVTRAIASEDDSWLGEYQKVVKDNFVDVVDHKNLNIEVKGLENINPTVENLALFAWETLADKFNRCKLDSITMWENDRTYCTYSG
jgi:6-pyruvoyltetrahydropterin/6-carboxytetrahydropterin synthase